MGARRFSSGSSKARPILTERDYDAVKVLLSRWARLPSAEVDWERAEALQQGIATYEARYALADLEQGSEWVEGIYDASLDDDVDTGGGRRWSDDAQF